MKGKGILDINEYKNSVNRISIKRKVLNIRSIKESGDCEEFDILKREKRYEVIEAIINKDSNIIKNEYILDGAMPAFQVNEWLNTINRKRLTGKKYAYALCKFLNYLELRGLEYWEADNLVVEDYILYRIYGESNNVVLMKSNLRYKTISDDVMVIKLFYKWLSARIRRVNLKFKTVKDINKHSYFYGQIFESEYDEIIDKKLDLMQDSKEYIKWYKDSEIDAIKSSFKTLRDKAIFMCTVDGGMRIDEILSVKVSGYNSASKTVTPSRSKSRKIRDVVLSRETCDLIDKYINTERFDAEIKSGKYTDYLFINLRGGDSLAEPLAYRNYYGIFKRYTQRAGLPVEKVRTHSGRSTKTMEFLKFQAEHPEEKLSDTQIIEAMGWSKRESMEPYINHNNEVLAKMASEKINASKEKDKNNGN